MTQLRSVVRLEDEGEQEILHLLFTADASSAGESAHQQNVVLNRSDNTALYDVIATYAPGHPHGRSRALAERSGRPRPRRFDFAHHLHGDDVHAEGSSDGLTVQVVDEFGLRRTGASWPRTIPPGGLDSAGHRLISSGEQADAATWIDPNPALSTRPRPWREVRVNQEPHRA